ncbi:MAG: PIN domain-containing protein [Euryarchaeota archaeon CG01_land_8_20_14_3_00_38_12]|nr:MAG: PIN domain-containing protein [Euryarchaeota archaeon CG01_land_8_20_14_3_00_38_12]PJB20920.1 MAG: PIN domain-containing protein [Euryarchaeota archaeon CG_4_9_14_3_um_filter_38_12]
MKFYFFDTSALVKRYHGETGSDNVDRIFDQKDRAIVISNITITEMISAFKRKENAGEIGFETMELLVSKFFADILAEFVVLELTDEHIKESIRLVTERNLRTLDALQLGTALEIKGVGCIFVSADKNLCETAKNEEMQIMNPED